MIWLAREFVQPIFFWRYLSRQKLPRSMLKVRNGVGTDLGGDSEDEGIDGSKMKCLRTDMVQKFTGSKSCSFILGNLEVLKLDPSVSSVYKMEVMRDADTKTQPLFRVTIDEGLWTVA